MTRRHRSGQSDLDYRDIHEGGDFLDIPIVPPKTDDSGVSIHEDAAKDPGVAESSPDRSGRGNHGPGRSGGNDTLDESRILQGGPETGVGIPGGCQIETDRGIVAEAETDVGLEAGASEVSESIQLDQDREMANEDGGASLDDLIEAIDAARWLAGRYEVNDVAVRRQRLPRVFENIRSLGSLPNWLADRLDAIEHILGDEVAQPSHRWARIVAEDSLSQLLDEIKASNP